MYSFRKYKDYQFEDFILDEEFKLLVIRAVENDSQELDAIISMYPEKGREIQQAAHLISKYSKIVKDPSIKEFKEVQRHIKRNIVFEQKKKNFEIPLLRVAAALILLLIATITINYLTSENLQTINSGYGENKVLILPDSSIVTLSANSSISYHSSLGKASVRKVWLKGEAFFEVNKTFDRKQFIVHSGGLNIEVLGTKFNVNSRSQKPSVVLTSGVVKVISSSKAKNSIIMNPGELVEYNPSSNELTKRENIKTDYYTSWKQNKYVCDNTSLLEIAQFIEGYYGLKCKFKNELHKSKKLTGTLPLNNKEVFIEILSETIKIKILKNNEELHFE